MCHGYSSGASVFPISWLHSLVYIDFGAQEWYTSPIVNILPKLHSSSSHICPFIFFDLGFWGGSMVKNLPAMQEMWIQSLGWEVPLEKEMATHSSILAWEIPQTGEPGGLQPMLSQRVRLLTYQLNNNSNNFFGLTYESKNLDFINALANISWFRTVSWIIIISSSHLRNVTIPKYIYYTPNSTKSS